MGVVMTKQEKKQRKMQLKMLAGARGKIRGILCQRWRHGGLARYCQCHPRQEEKTQ